MYFDKRTLRGKSIPGRRNSVSRGTKVGQCRACLRNWYAMWPVPLQCRGSRVGKKVLRSMELGVLGN